MRPRKAKAVTEKGLLQELLLWRNPVAACITKQGRNGKEFPTSSSWPAGACWRNPIWRLQAGEQRTCNLRRSASWAWGPRGVEQQMESNLPHESSVLSHRSQSSLTASQYPHHKLTPFLPVGIKGILSLITQRISIKALISYVYCELFMRPNLSYLNLS